MKKLLLLVSLFILAGCKKTDEKLYNQIYGTWTSHRAFVHDFMGGFFGGDYEKKKYIFYKPNYCDIYDYHDYYGFQLAQDSLSFDIEDKKLKLYINGGVLYSKHTISKLNDNRLELQGHKGDVFKYNKIQ